LSTSAPKGAPSAAIAADFGFVAFSTVETADAKGADC